MASVLCLVVFVLPFVFIALTAMKNTQQAALLEFSMPTSWHFWENLTSVVSARNYQIVRAFFNSVVLTVTSVTLVTVVAAMAAFVLQRRPSRLNGPINFLVLTKLIIPPAIVPTIWTLQSLGIYRTLGSMILLEATFHFAFCIMLFRAFLSTVPRELDEAATLDGASSVRMFFSVVLPVMRPVVVTAVIVTSVAVFNDFTNPLYFLPGDDNATLQLTLFNFQSQYNTEWNLLAMDVLLITAPPLIAFLFFNRKIIAGMAAGAVK
ncbi:carbohydrate ABC transporter permease [Streptomyces sp. NPDC096310]|uniref:carbohydrate ABC transporter permease n=1 Tax=Streptomyces sp. NPDC096310 TaxID=3366082 RepID=UPI003826E21F